MFQLGAMFRVGRCGGIENTSLISLTSEEGGAATHDASIAGPSDLVSVPARCRGPSRGPQQIFRYPRLETRVRPRMTAGFAMRPDSRRIDTIVGPHRRSGIR